MLPYTATDSLNAISRELGAVSAANVHDRIDVVLHRHRCIAGETLRALYERAGRGALGPEIDLERLLNAGPAVGAWDGERLMGFARAISDGQLVASIEEVIIDRRYRE